MEIDNIKDYTTITLTANEVRQAVEEFIRPHHGRKGKSVCEYFISKVSSCGGNVLDGCRVTIVDESRLEKRKQALDEMVRLSVEAGLYDDEVIQEQIDREAD